MDNAENLIEVKPVNNKLVLFYDGENLNVGWKQVSANDMILLKEELEMEFPLLDLYEEFRTITSDLLTPITFLSADEHEEAVDKFMKHFSIFKKKKTKTKTKKS